MSLMQRIRRDEGFAMLTAIFMGAVLSVVGIAAVAVAVDGAKTSRVDSATGKSLGAAEGAVTRAESYLHASNGGPRKLLCSPSCASNPWGNSATPQSITFPDGSTAKAWIEVQQAFAPPAYLTGTYIIHATGRTADGTASRLVDETVALSPVSFPLGVYTDSYAEFEGNGVLKQESLFSKNCITYRGNDHLNFDRTIVDAYYNIPPAAHSATYISMAQTVGCTDSASNSNHIHNSGACYDHGSGTWAGNGTAIYDQDSEGGDLQTASLQTCWTDASRYDITSKFDYNTLVNKYGYRVGGLTPEVFAYLKSTAQTAGTYYTTTPPATWPTASTSTFPIMFFDFTGKPFTTVNISTELNSYAWTGSVAANCTDEHPTVALVVLNGSINITGSANLSGALFAPNGDISIGDSAKLVGTTFSNTFKTPGTQSVGLNACYAANTNPVLLDPKPVHFRQVDQPG